MRSRPLVVALAAASLTVGGCSSARDSGLAITPQPAAADASTALGVIDALDRAGFAVPNPLDTTKQVCPRLGCLQSIVSDTVRISSFPTSAQAHRSMLPGADSQVGRFVVRFAPPMSEERKAQYWSKIRTMVGA
ncbi:MAG TPA: hypothetical protein VJR50_27955 [Mycobacterium sp.]|nr:hypothetical protein [Mycobacterium sp.]